MWYVLIVALALLALAAIAVIANHYLHKQRLAQVLAQSPAEKKVHTQAQTARLLVIKTTQDGQKKIEAMTHEEILSAVNDRKLGDN